MPEDERPRIIFKFREGADEFLDRLDETEDPWTELGQSESFREILSRNGYPEPVDRTIVERVFDPLPFGELVQLNSSSAEQLGGEHQNLLRYFGLTYDHLPEDETLPALIERLLEDLRSWDLVEFAELDGVTSEPFAAVVGLPENPAVLLHLSAAPRGIDAWGAQGAWSAAGEGITIADVESGWHLDHEDLPAGITPAGADRESKQEHGACVLGILVGKVGGAIARGGQGVSPAATAKPVSIRQQSTVTGKFHRNVAAAIKVAGKIGAGNVVLVEQQLEGYLGFDALPVEAQAGTHVYQAIKVATRVQNVLVVEPAGNGTQNLDNITLKGVFVLDPTRSPSRTDSGAVMVSAATSAVPHLRRAGCNYGSRVNCFAWGEQIVTALDLLGPGGAHRYEDNFGFTSGASAIVAGAAALVQSAATTHGLARLSARVLRDRLADVELNTPSCDADDFPIGVMPNLCRILNLVLGDTVECPNDAPCP